MDMTSLYGMGKSDIDHLKQHQESFLKEVRERRKPVFYLVEGVKIKVNPKVFPPATDTKLLAANIETRPGERILDLTTGSGVFALIAGLKGATGIAVDINPEAVENARDNFQSFGVEVKAFGSDLFQNIHPEEYDQIFVNGPFFEGEITKPLDYACYGARDFLSRLLSKVKSFLKPKGKMLIVIQERPDLISFFEETVARNNLFFTVIDKRRSDDKKRAYRLYKITRTDN